jgi:hypothetical protein
MSRPVVTASTAGPPPSSDGPAVSAPADPAPTTGRTTQSRFGEALELPWWAPVAVLPPLISLAGGLVLGAPVDTRVTDLVVSALMVYAVMTISTRVRSRNLQSVYISAAYAFWFFVALIWLVSALPLHLLR